MTVDLEKRSYQFALDTLGLLRPVRFDNISSVLVRQLVRSSTSVGANIAEAKAGFSNRNNTEPLQDKTGQISRILGKSIVTMKARAKP